MEPTISVIIPVYNVEPYIRQCLDSIVNQTYRNLEIIVIDDGSPDHCGEICDEYAAKDSRMIVIHKENGGLSAARNDGIMRATGEWLTFVDSDDWCELSYYEQFIKAIGNTNPDVFQACASIWEYPQSKKIEYSFSNAYQVSDRESIEKLMINILGIGLPWDKLYRTAFVKNSGILFDTSIKAFEDHLFNFQLFNQVKSAGGAVFAGYHYRQITMSISRGFNPNKPQINYDYITKLHHFIDEQNLPEKIRVAAYTDTILAIIVMQNCCFFHPGNNKTYREVANDIMSIKKWPFIHEAIWHRGNCYLTMKQRMLKYALRLPCVWPMKLLYILNMRAKAQ